MRTRLLGVAILAALAGPLPAEESSPGQASGNSTVLTNNRSGDTDPVPADNDRDLLPNALWVHPQVMSGGQPLGENGYRKLQRLGIRTVISVDGVRPNVAAARRHQLQMIHLPHGYDGIPAERQLELAHAFVTAPGPVYVHCHHGVHRSPAAAAIGCIVAGLITPDAGVDVLRQAGTGVDYAGLWNAVRQATPINVEQLVAMKIQFTESEPPPPLVDAMGRMETITEQLEHRDTIAAAADGASAAPNVAALALLLREEFTELRRLKTVQDQPEEFHRLLSASEDQAALLAQILKSEDGSANGSATQPSPNHVLRTIRRHCRDCHRQFRD